MATTTPAASAAPQPMMVAMVVSLAAFMEVLDTTITNVSLSHIAGSLAASQDESTWVLTSYLVANGIVLPLSGWLSGVMGRKNFFMLCIAGFTLSSLACGLASSLPMLIVFRLMQGLAGGGLQPTQQAIIMDSFPPEKRGTAFAITGITMIVAPILGPTLGGYITDSYSWRWIFFMNIPVGLLAFILVSNLVEDPPHAKAKGIQSIDYIGLSLVALGLGCLQVVLDKGQEDDWLSSNFILGFSLVCAASLITAVVWLLRQKEPIIDLALLKTRSFGMSCLMIFAVGFALYGCSTLVPLLLQSQFGYDATLAGLVLSPSGIAVIFLMPVAGKLVNKIQSRYLIAFGMFVTSIGMYLTSFVTPQTSYGVFVMMRILQVVGLPFLFVPTGTMAFSAIAKEKSSKASALYNLMRNLGGSFGIAILLSFVARHEQINQNYLSANLAPSNPVYHTTLSRYTHALIGQGFSVTSASANALGKIYYQLQAQAAFLAYGDTFRFVSVVLFCMSFVALLMPPNKVGKAAPPAEAAPAH